MKKISNRNWAAVKRVAMNVNPLVNKRDKNQNKINALSFENEELEKEIAAHEAGIKALTDGYTSEQLVVKVVEPSGKFNAKGEPTKVTKYVPSQLVEYDEEEKVYIIHDLVDPELNALNEEIDKDAKVDMVESNEDTIGNPFEETDKEEIPYAE